MAPRQRRAFIESRTFSKLANFDSKAASWKDWALELEIMAAAVATSSRDALDWAAQQETTILTVDDVEAGPGSVEINPQIYLALAELLKGEALDIKQNTTRGAGLEAWRKLARRFQLQTVGRKRTSLSRILDPRTVKVHELSRAVEQWEELVRSYQSRAREIISDDVRSGILTEMCLEHIKTHVHAAVRSEIETLREARQSSSNPDAMDVGSLNGKKGSCRTCGQRGHWAAECPKRGQTGQAAQGDDGKGQGKKGKSSKGKIEDGKGKDKCGRCQARKAFEVYCNHCWKWVTWKRIVSRWQKPRARVAKVKVQADSINPRQVVHFSWRI